MAGNQGLAQPEEQKPTGSRKFMIRRYGYWKPGLEVMSPDGITLLYKMRRDSGRLIVSTAVDPNVVLGTVGYRGCDVQVRNSSLTPRPRRFYGGGLVYASPAWNGANVWWKHKSCFSPQVIWMYEGQFVAKLGRGHGGFNNVGEIEVDEAAMQRAPGGETAVIEEAVMVSFLWIELRRRQRQRRSTSVAGDSSAGDSSSCS